MTPYRTRDVLTSLQNALRNMPVVAMSGLRQTGKTTLLRIDPALAGRRYVTFDDFATLEAARRDPESFVAGDEPLTIDEVHKCPQVLDAIKLAVDRKRTPGRFLLSGSSNLAVLKGSRDSLAGRIVHLVLHPFSRREIAEETATAPFLPEFFMSCRAGKPRPLPAVAPSIRTEDIVRGGMPSVALGEIDTPAIWFQGFEQTWLERDLRDLARIDDLPTFRTLVAMSALRTGQVLNVSALARDCKMGDRTAGRHLALMAQAGLIHELPPFLGNRASRLIKSPKLYFADSGIAAHLAGVSSSAGEPDEPMRGALFETWLHQNLNSVLSSHWPAARLHYWNVQGRHEVDFIVEAGRDVMALELKAAARWADRDLAGLRAFLAATPRCVAAVLLHNGKESLKLGEKLWALPAALAVS